jgi:hypothetical protein
MSFSIIFTCIWIIVAVGVSPTLYLYKRLRRGDLPPILEEKKLKIVSIAQATACVLSLLLLIQVAIFVHPEDKKESQLVRESLIGRAFIARAYEDPSIFEITMLSSDATSQTIIRLTKLEMNKFKESMDTALK